MFFLPHVPSALTPVLVPALAPLVVTQMAAARLQHLPGTLLEEVRAWPVESQQRARRNAMVASTALAQQRAEREDVEDFLARLGGPDLGPTRVPGHGAHSVN